MAGWSISLQVVPYLAMKLIKRFYVRFLLNRIVCMAAVSERGHCVVPGSSLVYRSVSSINPINLSIS